MTVYIILMAIGFVFLVKGADFVVKGAVGISKRLNLSEMLVGIVLIGIGTSLPEAIITIDSSIKGESDIILGNAAGSSICNILLVLGIAAIIRPMKVDKRLCRVHLSMSLLTIIALAVVCILGNSPELEVGRLEGIILLILTILYTIFTFFEGKNENKENKEKTDEEYEKESKMTFGKIFIYLVLGILGLKYGADFVVDNAVNIANYFNVSPAIISITIIAIGTSLPEIATAVIASIRKDADLAVGNVVGSNIYNICLLPAIGAIISPIPYTISFNSTIIFLLIATLIVMVLTNYKNKRTITRGKGVFLLLLYFGYVVSLFA